MVRNVQEENTPYHAQLATILRSKFNTSQFCDLNDFSDENITTTKCIAAIEDHFKYLQKIGHNFRKAFKSQ